jgi:hypothetical protein
VTERGNVVISVAMVISAHMIACDREGQGGHVHTLEKYHAKNRNKTDTHIAHVGEKWHAAIEKSFVHMTRGPIHLPTALSLNALRLAALACAY